jgi:transposase
MRTLPSVLLVPTADGHQETRGRDPKERREQQRRNRMVYNDWGLYGFVQMLAYKCLRFENLNV